MFPTRIVRLLARDASKLAAISLQPEFGSPNLQRQNVRFARMAQITRKVDEDPKMFCFQCEQTKSRRGCVQIGVCGKTPETSKLHDLLVHVSKGLAIYADRADKVGVAVDSKVPALLMDALFSDRFPPVINDLIATRDQLKNQYEAKCAQKGQSAAKFEPGPANYKLPAGSEYNLEVLEAEGEKFSVTTGLKTYGNSVRGVRELIIYGLKGTAAYYIHARDLGIRDEELEKGFYEVMSWLETADQKQRMDLGENLGQALKLGGINFRALELLDKAHCSRFGDPVPTEVQITPKAGKCFLVSGHDMSDLERILQHFEGKGVNVFTHGEMIPAHGYPGLTKFKCLAGHFGGGWQVQQHEFPYFPGPILVTTNCIIEPRKSYKDHIFTANVVGWPGAKHIATSSKEDLDFLLTMAKDMEGFSEQDEANVPRKTLTVGFGHNAILSHAGTVIDAVKSGALKRVFLVGGCDGSENKRNYFTDLVDQLPDDTLILTLGCAKYRFNRLRDYGTLGDSGIPRLLDMGQCNDSFGAVKVALALADAFNTDVNSLPLTLCISWFEQKAVAVLLSLLHLGVKNIKLGPVMPAFLTDEVCGILKEKFNLTPIELKFKRDAADIQMMMQGNV